MKKKKKKIAIILKNLKKIIKPHQIIFFIILVIGNTYAWFVYTNKVSNNIDVHVRAWNVLFKSGETNISDYFYVNIPNVYPGMTNFVDTLSIRNDSEISADVSYKILEAKIFDEKYVTKEGREDNNQTVHPDDLTSEELEEKLLNDYPFSISFALTDDSLEEVIDDIISRSEYSVTLSWPFESGNDEVDTYWGNKAYEYANRSTTTDAGIVLKIKIFVTQSN